jgi:hypothetical protein
MDRICTHQLPPEPFQEGLDLVAEGTRSIKVSLIPEQREPSTPPGLGAGESVPDVVSKEERMSGKVTHLIPSSGPESAGNPGTVGVASTACRWGR